MIKIEKHNAHGLNVVVYLTRLEALDIAARLLHIANTVTADKLGHFEVSAVMEDDNDRWEACELDFSVSLSR